MISEKNWQARFLRTSQGVIKSSREGGIFSVLRINRIINRILGKSILHNLISLSLPMHVIDFMVWLVGRFPKIKLRFLRPLLASVFASARFFFSFAYLVFLLR